MINRFMRIIVFFDLPVTSKKDRRAYADFRKFLIKDGFVMIQYSVYAKTTRNYDDAQKHFAMIKSNVPPRGAVRAMIVTEKQYANIEILAGERMESENLLDNRDLIEL